MPASLKHDPAREEADLRAYLGEAYDRDKLERSQELLDAEAVEIGDPHELYRTSNAYLYNLTGFAMTDTKLPYLEALIRNVEPGARILDYGCGLGSDGLMLLDAGYRVEFADFDNPSTAFLRWRLEQRGIDAAVHDLDVHVPDGFDAAFSFDVIEHVEDPRSFLDEMEKSAELVVVNLLEFEPHEQELHYELPIDAILRYASRRDLRRYEIHYETSHLLVYGTTPASGAKELTNVGQIARERIVRFARRAKRTIREGF